MVRFNVAVIPATPRNAHSLLEAFRFLMTGVRIEAGCVDCTAWIDPDATVRYTETWATETDMRRRVCSETFTSLLCVVECGRDARVQFDFVTETRGLEYVEEVREREAIGR
jgi:quinol monooxygenase YgiN